MTDAALFPKRGARFCARDFAAVGDNSVGFPFVISDGRLAPPFPLRLLSSKMYPLPSAPTPATMIPVSSLSSPDVTAGSTATTTLRNVGTSSGLTHVSHIAHVTSKLAEERGKRIRVMWFVDVNKTGIAPLFPWFAHTPEHSENAILSASIQDQSLLKSLPPFSVKTPEDLERIPSGRVRLRLDPDAEFMRDNALLHKIASVAQREGHSVEIRGSGLCHAFYLLRDLGVPVVTPFIRKHVRVRGRQSFGKLVRDQIPERIEGRGERVKYFILSPPERRRALAAKLMEEAQEVAGSTNAQDISSELADVLEVVQAIARVEGIEWSDVEQKAHDKRFKVGSFDQAKLLVETDIPTTLKKSARRAANQDPYKVKEQEGGAIIPFLSLMDDGAEFMYRGRAWAMKLRPEGVLLEELRDSETDAQLTLPLESDD